MTEKAMHHSLMRKLVRPNRFSSLMVVTQSEPEGMPWDDWMMKQPVCTPRELEEYVKRRDSAAAAARPTKSKASGALPHNTEWL